MRKNICLLAAAALAVSGFSYHSCRIAVAEDVPSPTTQPIGQVASDSDAQAIRNSLTSVVNTAVQHDGFSGLSQYLQQATSFEPNTPGIGANANPSGASSGAGIVPGAGPNNHANNPNLASLKDSAPNGIASEARPGQPFKNFDDINAAVDQLRKDWRLKYDSDFMISPSNQPMVFNDSFQIFKGNMGDAAQTASERVAPQVRNPGTIRPNGAPKDVPATAANIFQATVYVAPSDGSPAVMLAMTNEGDAPTAWKILVPQGTDQMQVHDALLRHLNTLHDNRSNWPDDKVEAYRTVVRGILSAFPEAEVEPHAAPPRAN